jgi:hypothetical protein
MTEQRQLTAMETASSYSPPATAQLDANQVSTKRGFPVYRTNPSVPSTTHLPTRTRRFHVPGGKASVIVDNSSGEIQGIGGKGFWWEEEVGSSRVGATEPGQKAGVQAEFD